MQNMSMNGFELSFICLFLGISAEKNISTQSVLCTLSLGGGEAKAKIFDFLMSPIWPDQALPHELGSILPFLWNIAWLRFCKRGPDPEPKVYNFPRW